MAFRKKIYTLKTNALRQGKLSHANLEHWRYRADSSTARFYARILLSALGVSLNRSGIIWDILPTLFTVARAQEADLSWTLELES